MLSLFIFIIVACLVWARVMVLSIPSLLPSVLAAPLVNVVCGFASDLMLASLLAWLLFTAHRLASPPLQRPIRILGGLLAFALAVLLACQVRYIEHFGMTFRTYHATALGGDQFWTVGVAMVLQSLRACSVLAVGLLALFFGKGAARRLDTWWRDQPRSRSLRASGLLLTAAVILNAVVIQLRVVPGINGELRYNVLSGAYYNWQEYRSIVGLPPPTESELRQLRSLLGGTRTFVAGPAGDSYPLWQERIATETSPEGDILRDPLKAFIAGGVAKDGPWNVILVIEESLRAEELASMGNAEATFASLTPALSRMAADGIRFTNVMGAGFRTHIGQTAEGCSLYASGDFTILRAAPANNAVCLGDIFHRHGYQTFFFYGADNNFDNQYLFYPLHGFSTVIDERGLPSGLPRGGWGVSDDALLQTAAARLEKAQEPFFATILTLSNHAPYRLPDDAPKSIDREIDVKLQLLAYVDWSLGRFYDRVKASIPHTIFLVIADHGRAWDDLATNGLSASEILKRMARIPFYLVVLGAPPSLRGREVTRLSSNVDVPPTLLSLLGWVDEEQQFMGEDAFSRQGPVFMDFNNEFVRLAAKAGRLLVENAPDSWAKILGAAARYNLFAPPSTKQVSRSTP